MTSAIRAIFAQTAIVFLAILISCTAWAKELSGRVVAIADGDTATVLVVGLLKQLYWVIGSLGHWLWQLSTQYSSAGRSNVF
jgi:hypothetical protein